MDRRRFIHYQAALAIALTLPGFATARRHSNCGFVIEESGIRMVSAYFGLECEAPIAPSLQALFGDAYSEARCSTLWKIAKGAHVVTAAAEPANRSAWLKAAAFCRDAARNEARVVILYACGITAADELTDAVLAAHVMGRFSIIVHAGREPEPLSLQSYLHYCEALFSRRNHYVGVDFNDVALTLNEGIYGIFLSASGASFSDVASDLLSQIDGMGIGKRVATFSFYGSFGADAGMAEMGGLLASLRSRLSAGWGIVNFDFSAGAPQGAVASIHLFPATESAA